MPLTSLRSTIHNQHVEIAKGRAAAGVNFLHRGAGLVQQFFEFTAAKIPEHNVRRLKWRIGFVWLHFGVDHSRGEKDVGQPIIVKILDRRAPANEARLYTKGISGIDYCD